jgi:hypothetical protein
MQGMRFLMLGENGQPFNHGVIQQKTTEERYLCTFFRQPQVSRLCHVDEIGQWNLFPNEEAMNKFIGQIVKDNPPAPPAGDTPPPPPPADPPGASKKTAKKVAKKAAKKPAKKASKKKANVKTKR